MIRDFVFGCDSCCDFSCDFCDCDSGFVIQDFCVRRQHGRAVIQAVIQESRNATTSNKSLQSDEVCAIPKNAANPRLGQKYRIDFVGHPWRDVRILSPRT